MQPEPGSQRDDSTKESANNNQDPNITGEPTEPTQRVSLEDPEQEIKESTSLVTITGLLTYKATPQDRESKQIHLNIKTSTKRQLKWGVKETTSK